MQQQSQVQQSGVRLGHYILVGVVGAVVGCFVFSVLRPSTSLALPDGGAVSANGLFAVQARLSEEVYGLYLIDTENQTLLLYSYGGPFSRGLRLLSARSFRYDRQLVDFNAGKPSPDEIEKLIRVGGGSAPMEDVGPVKGVPEVDLGPE